MARKWRLKSRRQEAKISKPKSNEEEIFGAEISHRAKRNAAHRKLSMKVEVSIVFARHLKEYYSK